MASADDKVFALLALARSRGLDVQQWFAADGANAGLISRDDFAQKVTGLGLGLAAGAEDQVAERIVAALEPDALESAMASARKKTVGREAVVDMALVLRGMDRSVGRVVPRQPPPNKPPKPRSAEEELRKQLSNGGAAGARESGAAKRVLVALRRALSAGDAAAPLDTRAVSPAMLGAALEKHGVSLSPRQLEVIVDAADAPRGKRYRRATFRGVRSYFWKLRPDAAEDGAAAPPSWPAWSDAAKSRVRRGKQLAFRRALGGLDHDLAEAELRQLLRKYDVVSREDVEICVDEITQKWLGTAEGRFASLKLAAHLERKGKRSTAAAVEKEVILQKQTELLEGEESSGEVTLELWRQYRADAHRRNATQPWRPGGHNTGEAFEAPFECDKPVAFAVWLEEKLADWKKEREAVQGWTASKRALARRIRADRLRAAPAKTVEAEVRSLVSLCDSTILLKASLGGERGGGGVQTNRSSRAGLALERTLREMLRSSSCGVVTKGAFDDACGALAFSLLADKRAAKKARLLADVETRHHLDMADAEAAAAKIAAIKAKKLADGDGRRPDDDADDPDGDVPEPRPAAAADSLFLDTAAADAAALDLTSEKQSDAVEAYAEWASAKKKAFRLSGKRHVKAAAAAGDRAAAAEAAANAALAVWKKAQRAVRRHERKAPPDAEEAFARFQARRQAVIDERARTCANALAAYRHSKQPVEQPKKKPFL